MADREVGPGNGLRRVLEWHEQQPDARPIDISVNLSARQVAIATSPNSVAEILARTGLEPAHLKLEITESILVEESASASATLEAAQQDRRCASSSTTSAPATPRSLTSTGSRSTA